MLSANFPVSSMLDTKLKESSMHDLMGSRIADCNGQKPGQQPSVDTNKPPESVTDLPP